MTATRLEPPLTKSECRRANDLFMRALFVGCRPEDIDGLGQDDAELLGRVRRRGEIERRHHMLRAELPRTRRAQFLILILGARRTHHRMFKRVSVRERTNSR